jgi:hypothetical protein
MKHYNIYASLCLALCIALPAHAEVDEVHTMGGSPLSAQSLFNVLIFQMSELRTHPEERSAVLFSSTADASESGESATASSETNVESEDGTVTVSQESSAVVEQESSVSESSETIISNENVSDDVPIEDPEPDYPTFRLITPVFEVELPIIPSNYDLPSEPPMLLDPPEPILKSFLDFLLP